MRRTKESSGHEVGRGVSSELDSGGVRTHGPRGETGTPVCHRDQAREHSHVVRARRFVGQSKRVVVEDCKCEMGESVLMG